MSMAQPFQPNIHPDKGIPAADAGVGAPEPSPGFGVGGEPDGVEEQEAADAPPAEEGPAEGDAENPFTPPDGETSAP